MMSEYGAASADAAISRAVMLATSGAYCAAPAPRLRLFSSEGSDSTSKRQGAASTADSPIGKQLVCGAVRFPFFQ